MPNDVGVLIDMAAGAQSSLLYRLVRLSEALQAITICFSRAKFFQFALRIDASMLGAREVKHLLIMYFHMRCFRRSSSLGRTYNSSRPVKAILSDNWQIS